MNLQLEEEGLISQKHQHFSSKNEGGGPTLAGSVGSAGWGRYAVILWLIVLLATVTIWALFATILVMDIGQGCDMMQSAAFGMRLEFTASPAMNREHYERMVAVGKSTAPYVCTYSGSLAQCYNEATDVKIDVWFTPKGPIYQLGGQPAPHDQRRLVLQTWPFGTTQFRF